MSFAFIPIVEVATLAVVARTGARRRWPFARSVNMFFVGHAPWLVWLALLMTIGALVPPRQAPPWLVPLLFVSVIPALWSARLDYHFFREVMNRSPRGAVVDVIFYRVMAWSVVTAYFFGIVLWSEQVPELLAWLGR